jgi:hypothetical protein
MQALPDVTNTGVVNLTQYFADTDDDLTYEVEVSDANVVTASVDGNSNAQANDTFTVTFSLVAPPTPYPTISIHNGPWESFTNLK